MSDTEKTERPTPKKLRDAREKGDVPRSKDLGPAAVLFSFFLYFLFWGEQIFASARDLIVWMGVHAYKPFPEIVGPALEMAGKILIETALPVALIVIGVVLLTELTYTGFIWTPEKIKPNLEKLDAIANFKELFSADNFIHFCMSVLKISVLSWVLWRYIVSYLGVLTLLPPSGMAAINAVFKKLFAGVFGWSVFVFVVFAIIDMAIQYRLFIRHHKMSKDEVKHEHKDVEGDPHLKRHRKELHRELLEEPVPAVIQRSTTVVVNPTHIAVALRYKEDENALPLVVGKGRGSYAQLLVAEARAAGVPVIQHVPLARALMAEVKRGQFVPIHLLDAVAEVLQAVRELNASWDNGTPS